MTARHVTVWVVEDSADYSETVRHLVDAQPQLACPHTFGSAEPMLEALNRNSPPDVILMDIGLPGMTGIEAVGLVKRVSPATSVIMLTIHEDNEMIFGAICAGASGYLLKMATTGAVIQGIEEVASGGGAMSPPIARRVLNMFSHRVSPQWDYQLTEREMAVLKELVTGRTKVQVAKAMYRSPHTVDTHIRNIYAKLHVNTRAAAVAKALNERIVTP